MFKKAIFILLLLFSTSLFARMGINTDFSIITQEEYEKRVALNKDKITKRYVVIPYFNKESKGLKQIKNEKDLLAKFSFLLKKNRYHLMQEYFAKSDTSWSINHLLKGMYFFSRMDYQSAITELKKYKEGKYIFLRNLLLADSFYEIYQKNKENPFFNAYQKTLDSANSPFEKKLIGSRMKYIKYV